MPSITGGPRALSSTRRGWEPGRGPVDILRTARGSRLVRAGLAGWALGGVAGLGPARGAPPKPADARPTPEGLRFANALLRDRRYDLAADQFERFLKTNPAPSDVAD